MIHIHSDKKIKTCKICQKEIKEIIKAGKELDKLGTWNLPKDIKKRLENREEIKIWERKK